MRICSLAVRGAGALVLAGALAGVPGGAVAHDQSQVRAQVSPGTAAPGGQVEVRVSGCRGTTGSAGSGAFTKDAELTGSGSGKTLSGSARVKAGLTGTYEITVICDGHPHQGVGTVQVGGGQDGATPQAPVRAGGGGTAHLRPTAAVAEETGPGTRHAVVGLVLAGAAAVAVALRSVRRHRAD
ncbi:hypothetical protein GCM10018785_32760 [Streptomyces longispororuber]|uniref:Lipoprotein n=1 Tax=Streptomyces longispororuber TaxID=68230 RepID=A0A919DNW1_9ACTN|nr:hypothetical protein [Streptomyces longispororuber]GHE61167.1 hypothetical protein GCM10018785_32760 [Streptomyces longispororuber]